MRETDQMLKCIDKIMFIALCNELNIFNIAASIKDKSLDKSMCPLMDCDSKANCLSGSVIYLAGNDLNSDSATRLTLLHTIVITLLVAVNV